MPDDIQDALPSYEKAILQTVAYKRIRETVSQVLKQFQLNTTQWMILGILHDNPDGQKISAIAHQLQVEVPLITTLSQALVANGYAEQTQDIKDRRSKPLKITREGQELLNATEIKLLEKLKKLEIGLSPDELAAYFRTLRTIIANAEKAE